MIQTESSKRALGSLSRLAKTSKLTVNELRVILALERIMARIEAHQVLRDKIVFKGGFVLFKTIDSSRFTRDIDSLAQGVDREKVVGMITDALAFDLEDGLYYGTPEISELLDQGDYGGYRIRVPFQIGPLPRDSRKLRKLSRVHIDIGFGDVFVRGMARICLPSLFDADEPLTGRVYPLDSIYAEKLQTLVSRGSGNSRAKDYYDLVAIFEVAKSSKLLIPAIRSTFENRETDLPKSLVEFFDSLDFSMIANAWGSVQLTGGNRSFLENQRLLRSSLGELDKLFAAG